MTTVFEAPAGMQTWSFGVIDRLRSNLAGTGLDLPLDGPWDGEPDKAQWIDAATDYDCLVVRSHLGALCGYVGVPSSHRLHGADFMDVSGLFEVAHGVNYSDSCDEAAPYPQGICHLPIVGRPANVWWFGFEYANAMWDVVPSIMGVEAMMRKRYEESPLYEQAKSYLPVPTYKNLAFVQQSCTSLAEQLALHA